MAQIKKLQQGGTVGLPAKPAEVKPAQKNQLKFLVDGEEFLMDETEFNAIADKAFTNEVRKGQAKLRDKGKWMQEFQGKLTEAKSGVFDIQSSGEALSNLNYTPNNPNSAISNTDGLNEDGTVAQRTGLGRAIAPRVSGSSDQMAGILNNYIGEGVINSRKNFLAAEQAKANAEQQKVTDKYNGSIKTDAESFANPSLGKIAFGGDWSNETAKKLILDKVWGKEPGHVSAIDSAFQKYVTKVFDPYYDDKLEDYKKAGVDLSAIRNKFSNIYDSTTKSFKTPLNGIGDLYRYSDALDSIATDSPLFNKNAYLGLTPPVAKTEAELIADKTAADKTAADAELKAKADAAKLAADKAAINGKHTDGLFYSKGNLITGKWAPVTVNANGKAIYDFYNPDAGIYVKGKRSNEQEYQKYLAELKAGSADPKIQNLYADAYNRNVRFNRNYNLSNQVHRMFDPAKDATWSASNAREQGNYAFKSFGATFNPAGAVNLTEMFRDAQGNPIKGGVFNIQSNNINHLGLNDTETIINTDDGKDFRGIIKQDANGKIKLYKRNSDGTLSEQNDPSLNNMLGQIANIDDSRLTQSGTRRLATTRSKYATTPTNNYRETARTFAYKNGGKVKKLQVGGLATTNTDQNKYGKVTGKGGQEYKSTKIKDAFNSTYEMGTQEKLETAALLADLTGVGLALTGAGSIAAGAAGAAGTTAQLAADISRDGLDWGDAGRAVLGYGLDAASAVPGLGLGAKAFKTLKSVKTAAKWLLPAMAGIGAIQAGGLLTDVVSGRKKLTDLSIDDFRTLTNGIHGVMGGARMINNRMAVKKTTGSTLSLAGGKTANLKPEQVKELGGLSGDAKINKAKEFAMDDLDAPVVNLKTAKDGVKAKAQFWKGADQTKNKEIIDINTRQNGFELKNINDYQGKGLKDRYMRWAINKAGIRNPQLAGSEYLDLPGATRGKQYGFLGDYFRKNTPTTIKRIGGPSGNPMMGGLQISQNANRKFNDITSSSRMIDNRTTAGYNPNKTSATEVIESVSKPKVGVEFNSGTVSPARKGAATKKQNKVNKGKKSGDQLAVFQQGGKFMPNLSFEALTGIQKPQSFRTPFLLPSLPGPYKPSIGFKMPDLSFKGLTGINNPLTLQPSKPITLSTPAKPMSLNTTPLVLGTSKPQGIAVSPEGNVWSKLKNLAGQVNLNDVSEFGRALATRAVNKRINTDVEAPLISAPVEIDVPVQGDLLNRSNAYNRAETLQRTGNVARTSDGQLNMIQNLEVNRQADTIRGQADLENANAVNTSRMMNLENIMKNNGIRNEVANRNISTLAGARQAERQAENQKLGMVAQPLLSFWENKNAEALRKEVADKQIDNQISLSGLSTQINDFKAPLLARATDLYTKSQGGASGSDYTPAQRAEYLAQYEAVQKQLEGLGGAAKTHALQLMKDNKYVAPEGYYSKYLKPSFKAGGAMNRNIKEMNRYNRELYKERLREVRNSLKDDNKSSALTLKEIQKVINKTLTGK